MEKSIINYEPIRSKAVFSTLDSQEGKNKKKVHEVRLVM